jgi:hypothetical protein
VQSLCSTLFQASRQVTRMHVQLYMLPPHVIYACRQAGDFNDVLGLGASYFAGQVLAVTHVHTKIKPPTAAVAARYALYAPHQPSWSVVCQICPWGVSGAASAIALAPEHE